MSLQEIVNVTITQESATIEQRGFATALILGTNLNSENRVEEFTNVDSELAALLIGGTTAQEYLAAVDLKAQVPCPVSFKIGCIGIAKVLTDDAGTYTAGDISLKVNGTEIIESFDTDKDTTLTALAATIQALDDVSTAVYSSVAHTITITPIATSYVSITDIDLTGITGTMAAIAVTTTGSAVESYTDGLNAIKLYDNDWYGIVTTSRTQADVEDVADWVEVNEKIYFTATADANVIDTTDAADTTTIAAVLKAATYARTAVIYHAEAATEYIDAALMGRLLPLTAGSFTAKFKTLSSITGNKLTFSQSTNARDKNANTYETIGGKNIIAEGTVAEGEFIDVIMFIDWLRIRMQEEVYSVLIRNNKVPYTPSGMVSISSAVEQILRVGQENGGISDYSQDDDNNQDGGFVVTLPDYDSISSSQRESRILNGVEFIAWLSGAIHVVNITGVVTY